MIRLLRGAPVLLARRDGARPRCACRWLEVKQLRGTRPTPAAPAYWPGWHLHCTLRPGPSTAVQRSSRKPGKGRCACGRRLDDAAVYVYRSRLDRYLFRRCECGAEWTEHQIGVDPRDPVSSDEVIEVHSRLAAFDGPISELLQLGYA